MNDILLHFLVSSFLESDIINSQWNDDPFEEHHLEPKCAFTKLDGKDVKLELKSCDSKFKPLCQRVIKPQGD